MPGDVQGTLKSYIAPAPQKQGWQVVGTPLARPSDINRPRKLRERHKMVIYLEAAGWKPIDIGRAMGYSPSRVSLILNSKHPEVLAMKAQAALQVRDNTLDLLTRFRAEAEKSLDTLVEVRDQTAEVGQRRLAARDILDRAGYSVVKKQINLNTNVPVAQLEGVMDKLAEAHEVDEISAQWVVKNPTKEKQDAA